MSMAGLVGPHRRNLARCERELIGEQHVVRLPCRQRQEGPMQEGGAIAVVLHACMMRTPLMSLHGKETYATLK